MLVVVVLVGIGLAVRSGDDDPSVDAGAGAQTTVPTASTSTSATAPATDTTATTTGGPAPTTTTATDCSPASAVRRWPIERRLAQLVMVGVSQGDIGEAQRAAELGLGGVFIRRSGSSTATYTSGGLKGLRTPDGVPVAVAVDDEGGRVQSIDDLVGDIPSGREMAELSDAQVRAIAQARAEQLRSYGVTVDFAPVVDVTQQASNEVIGDRSFGSDPASVTRLAGVFAEGLEAGGITPTLKHFPGHGHASGDTHKGAATTPPLASLRADDLLPYQTLMKPGRWVMVGHIAVPDLTDGQPASLSRAAIQGLLRDEMGFDGVVVSDELGGMQAISAAHSLPDAVEQFLLAGGDVALWSEPGQSQSVIASLAEAVSAGRITEDRVDQSVLRVLSAKGYDPCGAS